MILKLTKKKIENTMFNCLGPPELLGCIWKTHRILKLIFFPEINYKANAYESVNFTKDFFTYMIRAAM